MQPIPLQLRQQLDADPNMHICTWCGSKQNIEWNHALIYSGRQINEWYAIVALCRNCHRGENGTINKRIRDYCTWIALIKGLKFLQRDYPKRNWLQEKKSLDTKFLYGKD